MAEPPKRRGPVLIDLDTPANARAGAGSDPAPTPEVAPATGPQPDTRNRPAPRTVLQDGAQEGPSPADAPPIEDASQPLPQPRTMQLVARLVGRGPSRLTRFFINTGVALFTFLLSVAALRHISGLLTSYPLLGWIGVALFAAFSLACLLVAWREYRAWARFARIDAINRSAGAAILTGDSKAAERVADQLEALYRHRPDMEWAVKGFRERRAEAYDAQSLLERAEADLLAPLDQQARREIEAAARTVAAATALIPLALADVLAALTANLRMIRRMAEIYGGRAGAVGGWRLARTVMTHLIATGAVAAGDDLIHTVAGGGLLAKVSKRFGEGVVNGALTARVGIAAMEVCRPLPFLHQPKPKVGNLVSRGLAGLFGSDDEDAKR